MKGCEDSPFFPGPFTRERCRRREKMSEWISWLKLHEPPYSKEDFELLAFILGRPKMASEARF